MNELFLSSSLLGFVVRVLFLVEDVFHYSGSVELVLVLMVYGSVRLVLQMIRLLRSGA
jgi:hypothetical protein